MKYSQSQCRSKLGKIYSSVKQILYELFHFTIYLRLLLEAYQFLMMSSVSELYQMKYDEYASFSIAAMIFILCLFLLGLSYHLYSSTKKFYDDDQHYHCKEIVRGLKDTKSARMYTFLLVFRRFALVSWLICMKDYDKGYLIAFIVMFQVLYLFRIIYVRPFESTTDNLVEITNEVFFTTACCLLVYLNNDNAWSGTNTDYYLILLISNNLVVVMIMLGKFLNIIYSQHYSNFGSEMSKEMC